MNLNPQITLPHLESPRSVVASSLAVSVAVAAAVCAIFAGSARAALGAALPATGWAVAFLFLAVEHDVRCLRIPNWLTAGGLAAALALAFATGGTWLLGQALAGAGVALATLFVPFALRWLGAGDVKAMMVLGALWGPEPVLAALFWIFIAGGALAIALVAVRGEFGDLCARWARSARITLATRRLTYFGPAAGSAAGGGLPFAVAIGLGASLHQLWGAPWAV